MEEAPRVAGQIARIADKHSRQKCELLADIRLFVREWHNEIVLKTSLLLPSKISDENIEEFRLYVQGNMTYQDRRAELMARLGDIIKEENPESELIIIFKSLLEGLKTYQYEAVPTKQKWVNMMFYQKNRVCPTSETILTFVRDLKSKVSDKLVNDAAKGMNILKCKDSPGERTMEKFLIKLKRLFGKNYNPSKVHSS